LTQEKRKEKTMAIAKFKAVNRILGIFHSDKKGPSTHEAGQVVEIDSEDTSLMADVEQLVKIGALQPMEAGVTQHHIDFLVERGYHVKTIDDAQAFVDRMHESERAGFLRDAAEWVNLDEMTKAELVAHAKDKFNLDLDAATKKDELIEAIESAALEVQQQSGNQ
jgi:hypothetical protein